MTTETENNHDSFGSFLQNHRKRTLPTDVGLPPRKRSDRPPGLRREDVASLIGVSSSWYTKLEQGCYHTASVPVLERIAQVFRLSHHDRIHMFNLANKLPRLHPSTPDEQMTPVLQRVLDNYLPAPALIIDRDWNFIGWNSTACLVFTDFRSQGVYERNMIHQMFLDPDVHEWLVDWEYHAQLLIRHIRFQREQYGLSPELDARIQMVRREHEDFARWWDSPAVTATTCVIKAIQHPLVGLLVFEQTGCLIADTPGLKLGLYTPQDEQTRHKLEQLLAPENTNGHSATNEDVQLLLRQNGHAPTD